MIKMIRTWPQLPNQAASPHQRRRRRTSRQSTSALSSSRRCWLSTWPSHSPNQCPSSPSGSQSSRALRCSHIRLRPPNSSSSSNNMRNNTQINNNSQRLTKRPKSPQHQRQHNSTITRTRTRVSGAMTRGRWPTRAGAPVAPPALTASSPSTMTMMKRRSEEQKPEAKQPA